MSHQFLSLQEAALLVNKSSQTVRRLIKLNKLQYRRKRTPQGFNYYIERDGLLAFYKTKNVILTNQTSDSAVVEPKEFNQEAVNQTFAELKPIPEEGAKEEAVEEIAEKVPEIEKTVVELHIANENNDTDIDEGVYQLGKKSEETAANQVEDGLENNLSDHPDKIKLDDTLPTQDNLPKTDRDIIEGEPISLEEIRVKQDNQTTSTTTINQSSPIPNAYSSDYGTIFAQFQATIATLINQHTKDKEELYHLVHLFQERVMVLENHIKMLQAPKKRRWYEFWK